MKKFKNTLAKKYVALLMATIMLVTGAFTVMAVTGDVDEDIAAASIEVAKQVQAEGIVLLKNDDNVLPLAADKGVNVFGTASIDPYYGSSGSGSIKSDVLIGFYDGLTTAGIEYNTTLYDNYNTWYSENGDHAEMPVANIDFAQAKEYSDTAVIVIGRPGSEGGDLEIAELQLTADEAALVDSVATQFENVIVLFNIVNIMEMGFIDEYESIKAAALIWTPGEAGMESVGKMLSGEVNPSGKLQDTIAYQVSDHPSSVNFGDFSYADVDETFVEYEEGIYVGYRYFETFDVDVQYPFGYGLSYTTFGWSDYELRIEGEEYIVSLTVTNHGERAGKDVVQVYVSVPYIPGGVEKSAIQLATYVKTDLLQPGESATYEASFNMWDVASYDEDVYQAWILDKGTYTIYVSKDVQRHAHSFTVECGDTLVKKYDEVSGAEIKNLFGDAQNDDMTILSRDDAEGTYPSAPVDQNSPVDTSDMDLAVPPTVSADAVAPTLGAEYDQTILLQHVAANPALEDAFLDQLTLDETIDLICNGGYKTVGVDRLGIPETNDNDGPASVKGSGGLLYSDSGVAWPAGVCLSCTWNDELAYEHGVRCGIEAMDIGTDTWYAPAANLHRNPRGGRNFEYFSEDPIVCGRMSAAIVQGAMSEGLTVTVKHLVLNEQETNRWGILTWADEQSIRELYAKPFEIAIKEGGATGVMSAYSRIGKTWCGGSSVLLKDLLRNEWGYEHYVVSDFSVYGLYGSYMNPRQAVYAQNDALLTGIYVAQGYGTIKYMKEEYEAHPVEFGLAMRECVRDIIHMKMNSSAFKAMVEPDVIRVEGETATVTGKTVIGRDFIETADGASQGYVLCNLSRKGNVITWTFDVEQAGTYDMTMALATTNLFTADDVLSDEVSMKLNGADVDVSSIVVMGEGFLEYDYYTTYGPLTVELVEGTNTITWTVKGYSVPNVDYLEFKQITE